MTPCAEKAVIEDDEYVTLCYVTTTTMMTVRDRRIPFAVREEACRLASSVRADRSSRLAANVRSWSRRVWS